MGGRRQRAKAAAVDLFCGAGGLSYGLRQSGIDICAGIDADPACRHPFEANLNAKFIEMDAVDLDARTVRSLLPRGRPTVIAGCAPCQPFSCYSRSRQHDRWTLLAKFSEIVTRVRPDVVTMENVPGLARYGVFDTYRESLANVGYHCKYGVVNCAEYGVPQARRRLVFMASLHGRIGMPRPTHAQGRYVTVEKAIRRLDPIPAGGSSPNDPLHRSRGLSRTNRKRIRRSRPGGTWRAWPRALRAPCHLRETGRTYPDAYGRMRWDAVGPTITTQFANFGSGRFGHPEQHRALSLREGALLQTFPRNYSFAPGGAPVRSAPVARMIGNAVPVRLGAAIGRCISKHVVECVG